MNESLNKQAELLHHSYLQKLSNESALPFLSVCLLFTKWQEKCSAGRSLNGNSEPFLSSTEYARKANNALTNKDIHVGK